MDTLPITGNDLTIEDVTAVARYKRQVALTSVAQVKISSCRKIVENLQDGKIIYGINTGFGALKDKVISSEKLVELQLNIIRSHSAGIGDYLPQEVVRAMMLTRINSLARGNSGIKLETVMLLISLLNFNITPCVPEFGSVGASGDLAPLAHMSLTLVGEGKVFYLDEVVDSNIALVAENLQPAVLSSKEGLALTNGTSLMSAICSLTLYDAIKLYHSYNFISSLCLQALNAVAEAFNEKIHSARPHPFQISTAAKLCQLIEGSSLIDWQNSKIQDSYSLRCIPQVHGASMSTFKYVRDVLTIELNSSTDNPLIFENQEVLSGGNFHGQPIAYCLDILAIGLSGMANISERRINKLLDVNHNNGLPSFLIDNAGLNSGLMIAQYTAASLVNYNKILAHPTSTDSIPTSANQEDHVSMGATGALKLMKVLKNSQSVAAIELLCSMQAIYFREPEKLSLKTLPVFRKLSKKIPFIETDRIIHPLIEKCLGIIIAEEIADI